MVKVSIAPVYYESYSFAISIAQLFLFSNWWCTFTLKTTEHRKRPPGPKMDLKRRVWIDEDSARGHLRVFTLSSGAYSR